MDERRTRRSRRFASWSLGGPVCLGSRISGTLGLVRAAVVMAAVELVRRVQQRKVAAGPATVEPLEAVAASAAGEWATTAASASANARSNGRAGSHLRAAVPFVVTVVGLVGGVVACGSDDDSTAPELTGAAGQGQQLAVDKGCVNCHGANGQVRTGPTWDGIWGTSVALEDGRSVVVDRDYVARSVGDPAGDVVEGFEPIMPTFDLSDTEVDQIAAYLEAIGSDVDDSNE